jgi:hypothetical protein
MVAQVLIRVVDIGYFTDSTFGNTFLGASRITLRWYGLVIEVRVCLFYCICEETSGRAGEERREGVGIGHRTSTDEKSSTVHVAEVDRRRGEFGAELTT